MRSKLKRRGGHVDATGRSKHGPRFVMHPHWVLDGEAYRDLRALPRAIYTFLRRRFNGTNNGHINVSVRMIAAELRCSKDSAGKALGVLVDHGFIKCAQKGSFHWKHGTASR